MFARQACCEAQTHYPKKNYPSPCLLASMGVAQPQLEQHGFGCKNMKISKKEMVAVLTGMLPYIGFPKTLNALTAINKAYPEDE